MKMGLAIRMEMEWRVWCNNKGKRNFKLLDLIGRRAGGNVRGIDQEQT